MKSRECFLVVLFVLVDTVLSSDDITGVGKPNLTYFLREIVDRDINHKAVMSANRISQDEQRNDTLELTDVGDDSILIQDDSLQERLLDGFIKGSRHTFKSYAPDHLNFLLPVFKSSFETINTSSQCVNDTQRLMGGALSSEKWTIAFLDAGGKPGPSVTKGWLNFVGNYDQCEKAVAPPLIPNKRRSFNGEYCVFTISTSLPLVKPKIGLCLPDTCSDSEILAISTETIKRFEMNITIDSVECLRAEHKVTAATVMATIILILIGSLVALGTAYDLLYVHKWGCLEGKDSFISDAECRGATLADCQSTTKNYQTISEKSYSSKFVCATTNCFAQIILAFSALTNGKKVLNVSQSSDSLGSIHGIRYLSICWVVLGHTYLFGIDYSINKTTELPIYFNRWTFDFIANALLSVDTFFVLTGLLTSFHAIREMKKTSWKINWPLFYFHRFWRLTPPYMFVIVISLGLTQYVGEGPLWSNEQPVDKKECEDNWWKNLLYINNFYKVDEMCMPHSWYLPNDMQFYVVSPLLLIPLHIHRVAGIFTCLVFLVASWIITGVLSTVNDWTPTYISIAITRDKLDEYLNDFYFKPWCRIGPFIIGILAGYLLTHIKGKSLQIRWWVVALGWILAIGSALSVIYGLRGDISTDDPSSTEVAALYNAIARSVWGAAICWIIIACDAGYGGPVNTLLSWSPFVVLGRVTYMTYLIHPYIMRIYFQNMGSLYYMNNASMPIHFIGLLVFSNFAAFIFMLCFESPMIGLEKIFFPKK